MSPCGEIRQELRRTKGADGLGVENLLYRLREEITAGHSGSLQPWSEQSASARRLAMAEWVLPEMKWVPPFTGGARIGTGARLGRSVPGWDEHLQDRVLWDAAEYDISKQKKLRDVCLYAVRQPCITQLASVGSCANPHSGCRFVGCHCGKQ